MITVFGSINMDLIATTERLPKPGETVAGNSFATAAGGKGANQALAAVRAGAKVRMIGAVGGDAFAAEATALLAEGGVDLSAVSRSGRPTGVALILVGDDGENVIAVVPGANDSVLPGDLSKAFLANGDVALLQHEGADAFEERGEAARPSHPLVWHDIRDRGSEGPVRSRSAQPEAFAIADLALDASDRRVPAREALRVGQEAP